MSITNLLTQTLVVYRKATATRDAIGAEVIATETPTQVDGYLEPITGSEDAADRNTQIGEWRAFVGPSVDVTGWDRIECDGRAFDIVAPPMPMVNARTGATHHIELKLVEVV